MEALAATNSLSPWEPGFLSLFLYSLMVLGFVVLLLFLAGWLGEKKKSTEKRRPYECGIIPTGSARFAYPVPFYLVAAFFLIFDVEAAYIFSWAISFRQLGWQGWFQIAFFIFVLLTSLFYIWAKGGLDWRPQLPKKLKAPRI
jgi:NADH-quinone oxidoreductase subunit A